MKTRAQPHTSGGWGVNKTPVYNLKKKLIKAIYGIDIFETK